MKKIISLLIVCALMASLAITASAEENIGAGSYSSDVTGSYVADTTVSGTVFSVDITWTNLSFTYHDEQKPVWDTENHKYSETTAAYWEGTGTITVINHSNASIRATPTYTKNTGYESASMIFSAEKLNIPTAAYYNQAVPRSITVTPTGSLPKMNESATIGFITVTIAENPDVMLEDIKILYDNCRILEDAAEASGADQTYSNEYFAVQEAGADMCACIDEIEYQECENWNDGPCAECQDEINSRYEIALNKYNRLKALMGL